MEQLRPADTAFRSASSEGEARGGFAILDRVQLPADLRRLAPGDLRQLADELRAETLDAVSQTGGHLGAGLGVVELTVALHYVFDTPRDRLVWDVGHQAYPHKILTGRRGRIRTMRQGEGLSGFTRRSESEYDPFGAAHSSTSVSAGLGMAIGRDLAGEGHRVICVIGDGALSAGLAYEALNNAGAADTQLLVILNDNAMSIAPPTGALSRHLTGLAPGPGEPGTANLFEHLGFRYVGPIDGHDLGALLPTLETIRDGPATGPVLLHVLTEKGHGYPPAARSADRLHAVGRFDVATGAPAAAPAPRAPSYTRVFADALIRAAEDDPRIVAITAAMPGGTGVDLFGKRFPERAFDVGIAEQHAVTFAAGLATEGWKPFCAIYSTFLQRAYDQVVHDVALQRLPVRFAIDRAGLVGADGATHAGSFDLAYLACLPGFVIMAAADEAELVHMVTTAVAYDDGPIAFRYPRGEGAGATLPDHGQVLPIGRGRVLREGRDVALLSIGTRLQAALAAADYLQTRGLSCTVADARFIKPLDRHLVRRLAQGHRMLVTIEESAMGGFGAQVLDYLVNADLMSAGLRVRTLTLPDTFLPQDEPDRQYALAGLNPAAIAKVVETSLARSA